jgi:hypothetical protein
MLKSTAPSNQQYDADICFDIALDRNNVNFSHEEKKLAKLIAHQHIKDASFDRNKSSNAILKAINAVCTLRKVLDKLGTLDEKTTVQLDEIKSRLDIEYIAISLAISYTCETTEGWPGWGMGTWGYDWKAEYSRRLDARKSE